MVQNHISRVGGTNHSLDRGVAALRRQNRPVPENEEVCEVLGFYLESAESVGFRSAVLELRWTPIFGRADKVEL